MAKIGDYSITPNGQFQYVYKEIYLLVPLGVLKPGICDESNILQSVCRSRPV
jgi:hypothetical protein